jgi:hypothetical protein
VMEHVDRKFTADDVVCIVRIKKSVGDVAGLYFELDPYNRGVHGSKTGAKV